MLCSHRSHCNLIHVTPRGKSRRTLFHRTLSLAVLRRVSFSSTLFSFFIRSDNYVCINVSLAISRSLCAWCSSTFNRATIIVIRGCYMYTPYYIGTCLFSIYLFIHSLSYLFLWIKEMKQYLVRNVVSNQR